MLAPEYGALRPWEMADLTPYEEHLIVSHRETQAKPQQEVTPWPPPGL